MRSVVAFGLLVAMGSMVACSASSDSGPGDPAGGGTVSLVPPGKADDYFSTKGQEYTVTGQTYGTVEASCVAANPTSPDAQKRCSLESINLKNFAIAFFLNQYIIDKHDAPNENWGGFTAMTRPESYESLAVSAPDASGKFSYDFTSELSGPMDLLDKVPTVPCGADRCFTLEIPVIANATLSQMTTGSEWYRKDPYKSYSPETYTGEKEKLELTIKPYPRSNDAFLEYNKLFEPEQLAKAGGKLKIGLFVGWDYYEARYDLQTAKELYRWLVSDRGFKSPVASYDAYKLDSGELTKTIKVNGSSVEVSVLLVHPGQGDPNTNAFASEMKNAMIKSFGERQIIAYEGHAGPFYGFSMSNWNVTDQGELDDSELPGLAIPENFYQVLLASGCDTYMVADSLYQNPVKQGRLDLDIITTTSFSNAGGKGRTSKLLVDAVINQQENGSLQPKMYGQLLRDLNAEMWMTPIYGVHGIDDNPRVNPFADPGKLCDSCKQHAECGGYGSLCMDLGGGTLRCGTQCESDADCGEGFMCFDMRDGDTLVGRACAPKSLSCEAPLPAAPVFFVNELHYENTGTDQAEGVEIAGTAGADLLGFSLVFYNGSPASRRVYKTVSLQGKLPSQANGFGTLWFPVTGIQNGGADSVKEPDGVALVDPAGNVVQLLSYEGAFTPTNGPAAGRASGDIGVSQPTASPLGQTLGLTGAGKAYEAFAWKSAAASPGQPNPGQSFQ